MRLFLFIMTTLIAAAGTKAEPIKELAALAPFTGKTWRSVSGSVDGSADFSDVSKWEWTLGGRVVRITHSVNQGAYAGESLIHWDDVKEKIIFRYVTTAGFYTDGVISATDGGIEVHEIVGGAKSGPSETLSGYSVRDGRLYTWAKIKANGEWSEISETVYEQAPGAEVVFPQ